MKAVKPNELRIAIVGGGPSGLSTAIALQRKGFHNVVVYERDITSEWREQGYSFTLFSNEVKNVFAMAGGLDFLKELGLFEEMDKFSFHAKGFRYIDGCSGKALLELNENFTKEDKSKRVLRSELRKLLLQVCEKEGIKIVWNSKLLRYEEKQDGITLYFENKEVEADVVLGADGVHSAVRNQLVGDPVLYTGYTAILYHLKSNQVLNNPWYKQSGGLIGGVKKSLFFYDHTTTGQFMWSIMDEVPEGTIPKQWADEPQKFVDYAKEHLKDFAPVVQELVNATTVENASMSVIELRDRDPLVLDKKTGRYCGSSSKSITLIGDAAHPMLPTRAAGGNNALTDAWSVSTQLAALLSMPSVTREDINRVLTAYEKEMAPRGSKAVLASRKAAHALHTDNRAMTFARDSAISLGNWYLNVYCQKKALQWAVKTTAVASAVAAAALLQQKFHVLPLHWK